MLLLPAGSRWRGRGRGAWRVAGSAGPAVATADAVADGVDARRLSTVQTRRHRRKNELTTISLAHNGSTLGDTTAEHLHLARLVELGRNLGAARYLSFCGWVPR